ncbi:LamG-like jellyroll fold domain-containing protein [Flavobacterium sp. N3904]|uniref:LamG-like jellyroll fold domain-containing protein n=1 Tax=Flavobacterium sp. N3904 TaxID=2986835 RepID=UPI002223FE95|nr:LamG-like jellyroll fold domain-containing protein [Flavobacterium sp. N3904]
MKKIILFALLVLSLQVNAQTPIQEFKFNGNRSNTQNDNSFLGIDKFVNDRAGVANSAIRVSNTTMEVTLPNLPLSNAARTISIWVKYNDITTANYIWGYGSSFNAQYFGLLQQSTTTAKSDLNLAGWGPANDAIVNTTIAVNTWYNYTVTYDGLTSKIYRNGELIRSSISPRKLTSGIVFSIGKMGSAVSINADIDDLKIYDVALTSEEVAALYNDTPILAPNNLIVETKKVETKKVETKTTLKKGTAKNGKTTSVAVANSNIVLNTPIETIASKKSEIFSTQGQKVIVSDKQEINISTLPEGTYLLKITNSPQSASSKKLTSN